MEVIGFCYEIHFHYLLPLKKISKTFPTRIEIIHGSHSLYHVLTWVTLFSLHNIEMFTKIMLSMLKLDTNSLPKKGVLPTKDLITIFL